MEYYISVIFDPPGPTVIGGQYFDDGVRVYVRTSGVQTQNKLMTYYAAGPGGSL